VGLVVDLLGLSIPPLTGGIEPAFIWVKMAIATIAISMMIGLIFVALILKYRRNCRRNGANSRRKIGLFRLRSRR